METERSKEFRERKEGIFKEKSNEKKRKEKWKRKESVGPAASRDRFSFIILFIFFFNKKNKQFEVYARFEKNDFRWIFLYLDKQIDFEEKNRKFGFFFYIRC